jgi:hypothetical protein
MNVTRSRHTRRRRTWRRAMHRHHTTRYGAEQCACTLASSMELSNVSPPNTWRVSIVSHCSGVITHVIVSSSPRRKHQSPCSRRDCRHRPTASFCDLSQLSDCPGSQNLLSTTSAGLFWTAIESLDMKRRCTRTRRRLGPGTATPPVRRRRSPGRNHPSTALTYLPTRAGPPPGRSGRVALRMPPGGGLSPDRRTYGGPDLASASPAWFHCQSGWHGRILSVSVTVRNFCDTCVTELERSMT